MEDLRDEYEENSTIIWPTDFMMFLGFLRA